MAEVTQRYALREEDRTSLCRDCGAVVWDTARHDRWHAKQGLIGPARFEVTKPGQRSLLSRPLRWPDEEDDRTAAGGSSSVEDEEVHDGA